MGEDSAERIRSIRGRRILNSHVGLTNEFVIELESGGIGVGASPQGETISVYEDASTRSDVKAIIREIRRAPLLDSPVSQADFDEYLHGNMKMLGRNNCWALSLAFFNAVQHAPFGPWRSGGKGPAGFPLLCLNVLNGGHHAYTNPVLSDFPEFLIVPRDNDVSKMIRDHADVQAEVRKRLASCERLAVNQNPVHRIGSGSNGDCVSLLRDILDRLGLDRDYQIMIDASAGDLWGGSSYRLPLTDGESRSTDEMREYWLEVMDEFGIGFLEDPLGEHDFGGWAALAGNRSGCRIIGDNLYSSDARRIEEGSRNGYTHGAIIKPNQAGTVSAALRAIESCRRLDQIAITSHRSISTESPFLSHLTVLGEVRYMKIGPLLTDYSSVIRLNELIRLTGVEID